MPNANVSSPGRKSIRMAGFDYSSPGHYFVTMRTAVNLPDLSLPSTQGIELTVLGEFVQSSWDDLPARFPGVLTDTFSVQPDHVHGVIAIEKQLSTTLGGVMRAFKSISARAINQHLGRRSQPAWKRGYYERVIRNERELENVRSYVEFNWLKTLEQTERVS